MTTKFTDLKSEYERQGIVPLSPWVYYLHASKDWLHVWSLLKGNVHNMSIGGPFFYTKPHAAHFALELAVKARISYADANFNPKNNNHRTSKNIADNQSVSPIFQRIMSDKELFGLIEEYEKTVYARFGEMAVETDSDDEERIISIAIDIRNEMDYLRRS